MASPEHSSALQTILHTKALSFDRERIQEVIHSGLVEDEGEAVRYLEDEAAQEIDQPLIWHTASMCDPLLGIDLDTEPDKFKEPLETSLGEGVFVTVFLLEDHPHVAREYIISYPDPEDLGLRRDLILILRCDGRLNSAVMEQVSTESGDWEGIIVKQEYATSENLQEARRVIK